MHDKDGFIWLDGEWVEWREAKIHVLTHTLHYGMGAFEGVRAYNTKNGPAIFRLEEHTNRLFNSADILGINIPFTKDLLNQVQKDAIIKNNLESAYIRPMCFYGSEGMGLRADNLKVHVMVAAWYWGAYLGSANMEKGIRICTSSFIRQHGNPILAKAKINGNYINSMMALKEAINQGYDEALMLDSEGFISEGSGENIFIIKNKKIYTPDLTSALPGITRDTIFTIANDLNYKVFETKISCDDVLQADEAFFTGTAAEVTPISSLDGKNIGSGKRGAITKELQSIYFNCVSGKNDKYNKWIDKGKCQ